MSILVAVIAIVAVEWKAVKSDPAIADPLYYCLIGTTGAAVLSGVIALLGLLRLRLGYIPISILAWLFGILIAGMIVGICLVVQVLTNE
jgi:hypothetical protein